VPLAQSNTFEVLAPRATAWSRCLSSLGWQGKSAGKPTLHYAKRRYTTPSCLMLRHVTVQYAIVTTCNARPAVLWGRSAEHSDSSQLTALQQLLQTGVTFQMASAGDVRVSLMTVPSRPPPAYRRFERSAHLCPFEMDQTGKSRVGTCSVPVVGAIDRYIPPPPPPPPRVHLVGGLLCNDECESFTRPVPSQWCISPLSLSLFLSLLWSADVGKGL
jgi:hypothetical protein